MRKRSVGNNLYIHPLLGNDRYDDPERVIVVGEMIQLMVRRGHERQRVM